MKLRLMVLLAVMAGVVGPGWAQKPQPADHWVGTWAAADYSQANKTTLGSTGMTLRQVVHVSLGGSMVRVKFSNEFGAEPLVIGRRMWR